MAEQKKGRVNRVAGPVVTAEGIARCPALCQVIIHARPHFAPLSRWDQAYHHWQRSAGVRRLPFWGSHCPGLMSTAFVPISKKEPPAPGAAATAEQQSRV